MSTPSALSLSPDGLPGPGMAELMEAYFARVMPTPSTRRGYAADLECLAVFLGLPDGSAAIDHLLLAGPAQANLVALRFLAAREAAGDKPGTRRRRLAAIRSALGVARLIGMISWHIEVSGPKASAYRDTRGPGLDGVKALLGAIRGQSPKATRDRALVRLMFDTGLRRGEVVGLDVEHLDLARSRVSILGKARDEREFVTLPDPTKRAIGAWLAHRGLDAGPLFIELARNGTRGRLSGRSVHRVITRLPRRRRGRVGRGPRLRARRGRAGSSPGKRQARR